MNMIQILPSPYITQLTKTKFYFQQYDEKFFLHVVSIRLGRGEVHTGFWWGNLRERDRSETQA